MATMTKTMAVVIAVSRRDGQVTLRVSSRTSWRNLNGEIAIHPSPDLNFSFRRSRALPASYRCRQPSWLVLQPDRASSPSLRLAGVEGLEPPTPGFGDRCS